MSVEEGQFMVSLGAIIEHHETRKILILHRSIHVDYAFSQWDIAGGRIKQSERPKEALLREIKEETGITQIKIIKPLIVLHTYRGKKHPFNEMICINYWCQTNEEKIALSKEHDKFYWITAEEAHFLVNNQLLKMTIQRFIEESGHNMI